MKPRDTYLYELRNRGKIVYVGTSDDPDRRAAQHEAGGKVFTSMKVVGRAKTEEGARAAERERLETYRRNHGGQNPKYNLNDCG